MVVLSKNIKNVNLHPQNNPLYKLCSSSSIHLLLHCCHANIPGDGVVMATEQEGRSADVQYRSGMCTNLPPQCFPSARACMSLYAYIVFLCFHLLPSMHFCLPIQRCLEVLLLDAVFVRLSCRCRCIKQDLEPK